jgi:GTPase SAR1 family protein
LPINTQFENAMPEILQQLQAILKPLKIHLAPARDGDPLASLMPFKEDYPKYALDEAGNIIGLNLARTGLTDEKWQEIMDVPGLADHLQALNLCENELTEIHFPASMTALRFLNLSENKNLQSVGLQEMSPSAPLEWLDLSECAITIFFFSSFLNLQKLDLSRNKLTKFFIQGNCPKLFLLDASGNQLTTFELYGAFEALKYLYLNDNQIETLGFKFVLNALEILHLRNNKLDSIPNFLPFPKLQTLYLFGNPLPSMHDVISGNETDNSWDALRAYLQSQRKSDLRYLHQAKMVLVGNGEVGKSSIRVKLLDKTAPLPKKHERTPGLDIQPYTIDRLDENITNLPERIDFQLNIWDFGGQGKYREVQQLFCSRKTLYLFVTAHDDLPEKEDYVGFEYWLSMVDAFSFDDSEKHHSPVIHVVNKIDEQEQLVDEKDRKSTFPSIERFVKISCEKLTNFAQLEDAIREVLPLVSPDVFTAQFTEFWLAVKAELERLRPENHISKARYLRICAENNLDEYEANHWIRILDRIGTVIYFGENPDLQDWVILNPIWAKDALYNVLNSTLVEGGILEPKFFPTIWRDYSPEEREQLIKLMLAYKLCYQQKNGRGELEFIVPALFHDTAPNFPDYLKIPEYQVKFTFTPFIPAGTVNKLMVLLHEETSKTRHIGDSEGFIDKMERALYVKVDKDFMWKNNVVVQDVAHNTHAHVREVWEEKTVYLDLFGKDAQPLYEHIRQMLESINQTLISTKYMTQLNFESWAWHEKDWETFGKLKKFGVEFFPGSAAKTENITPSNTNNMDQIKQLIAAGRLGEALQQLHQSLPSSFSNEGVLLKNRFAKLESDTRMGVIAGSDANIERNKITNAILSLIDIAGDNIIVVEPQKSTQAPAKKTKILFLAANPTNAARLQTDKEHRLLKAQLERGRARDGFEFLPPQFAVTILELVRAMNDAPNIVHFSGHGDLQGIAITDENNGAQVLPTAALKLLFKPHQGEVQMVILNACYSSEQARVLSEFGIFVVGNNQPISDPAAISFTEGFYNGLGEGKTFEGALNDAMIVVLTQNEASAGVIDVWKDGEKVVF